MRLRSALCCVFLALPALLMPGCARKDPPLYAWGSFPHHQYEALRREGGSLAERIAELEEMAATETGKTALPPGFRAHLGMLYLAANEPDRARVAWQAEITEFPESEPFIATFLAKLDATGHRPESGMAP